jgi:hypothetical protein
LEGTDLISKNYFEGKIRKTHVINVWGKPKDFDFNMEIISILELINIVQTNSVSQQIHLQKEYILSRELYYFGLDNEKIIKTLVEEMKSFKLLFNYYFEIFVLPLYKNRKVSVDDNLFSNYDIHYTFNYTPTFKEVYNSKIPTIFLHGEIDSTIDSFVMGISEIPKNLESTKFLLAFTKYFQKIDIGTDVHFYNRFQNKKTERTGYFFYGHSLDLSDKDFINDIFNLVISETETQNLIVILYHNKKSKSNLILNLLNVVRKENIEYLRKTNKLFFIQNESHKHKELLESLDLNSLFYK